MYYSRHFRVKQSSEVYINIIPENTSGTSTPSTVQSTQLTSIGTPDVPLQDAFGPGYDVFATAQLSASSFEVDPTQQIQQSLDQREVHFVWTVTPKYPDLQQIYATITGIWIPKSGGSSITRPLGSISGDIFVESMQAPAKSTPDENPFFASLGQNLLLALIGSVLNIPWIWDLVAKRRKRRQSAQESVSQHGLTPQVSSTPTQPQTDQKEIQQETPPGG